ncbi:hypothetical protein L596_000488 [Steinernema carpocapsae]|uniref:EGF-like domain-containing protein n=1 Tax=Steinernema carpocapsae TaxID=34508 RepID=A0A4U8UJP0_STECR|nr:hypothetical protein L596_000488 [Steinernema carpocapsae]
MEATDRCVCPPGFFGTHCDSVTELPSPQTGFPLVDDTFNLYAYNEISLYNGAVALIEFVKAVEKDVHVQKDYKAYNYWHYTENKHGENATAAPEASMTHTTKWDDFKKALEATTFADPNYDCSPVNLYQNLLDLIQQQKLTSTTVTVFTQFPGHSHWIIYQRLLATAAAFRIRFNFLVTDDPLLLSCNFTSDEFVAMKNLAINTGGSFVLLNDQTAQFGIAPVIQMHYQTQLVAFTSKDDCSSVPFSFITDFDTMTYTIIVNTLDQSGSMTCEGCDQLGNGTQNSRFYAKELGLNVPQDMTLKFRGPCTVQVLTDKASVRLFQSFVPKNSGLDSAYIQPVIGVPSTIRIHAQMDNQPIIQNTVATQIQIGSETINALWLCPKESLLDSGYCNHFGTVHIPTLFAV